MPAVEVSRNFETSSGASVADEVEDLGITIKRFRGPIFGNLREQAVLDGIPFGSAGGVVGNSYCQAKAVAELALKLGFPGARTATVAATGVGKDEQLPAAMVATSTVALPPTGDRVGGKGCRVMRDPYIDRASVGEQVVDTVRDRDTNGIRTEIVIIDAHGRAIPLDTIVLEVADQFSLFGIDADDGKALVLKAGT